MGGWGLEYGGVGCEAGGGGVKKVVSGQLSVVRMIGNPVVSEL